MPENPSGRNITGIYYLPYLLDNSKQTTIKFLAVKVYVVLTNIPGNQDNNYDLKIKKEIQYEVIMFMLLLSLQKIGSKALVYPRSPISD